MVRTRLWIFPLLSLLFLVSCGSSDTSTANYGSIAFRIVWPAGGARPVGLSSGAIPPDVQTVRMIVTGPGMNPMQQDFAASAHTGTINGVPVGANRTLTLQALGSAGDKLYEGVVAGLNLVDGAPANAGDVMMALVGNLTPVSDAGVDQNVLTGEIVSLDGSGSSDVNGDPLTYSWSFVSKPSTSTAVLGSTTEVVSSFSADLEGSYVLQLVVNDGKVNSAADTVTITAATTNAAPVANAGGDQGVATGGTVTLDGSGSSDANGDPLTYNWAFVSVPATSAAVLSSAAAVNPTFAADKDGSYVLQLVVNDGAVSSLADSVTITASTTYPAPIPNTGQTATYVTGDDGDLRRGVVWPSPRFIDHANGTVTDSLTGLIWLKTANCLGPQTWSTAVADANTLASGNCGLTDGSTAGQWHLPSRRELSSLIDRSGYMPSVSADHPFVGVQSNNFWTSSTYANNMADAWYINLGLGNVYPVNKTSFYYVWPVRGGQ